MPLPALVLPSVASLIESAAKIFVSHMPGILLHVCTEEYLESVKGELHAIHQSVRGLHETNVNFAFEAFGMAFD